MKRSPPVNHRHILNQMSSEKDQAAKDFAIPIARSTQASTPHVIDSNPPAQAPVLRYETPPFSRTPDTSPDAAGREPTYFEVIKNGVVIEKCLLAARGKEFLVVGRVPTCDIELEHASVSRLQAVLQFGPDDSVLLYDLGSAHGTFINKIRAPARTYVELHEADQVRFGASTRVFVLQGRTRQRENADVRESNERLELSERETDHAAARPRAARPVTTAEQLHEVTWGFDEDAAEDGVPKAGEPDEDDTGDVQVDQNAYYVKDPRKALRVWLDARGLELEFEHDEEGKGHERVYVARIRAPLAEHGSLVASGSATRKKDAEREACLDACAKLDKRGLLRISHPSGSRKRRAGEDDDLDDSTDDFYNRAASKPKKRSSQATDKPVKVENLESLTLKLDGLRTELAVTVRQLDEAKRLEVDAVQAKNKDDELDDYMAHVKEQELKTARQKLETREAFLKKEMARVEKMLELVKPSGMGRLTPAKSTPAGEQEIAEPTVPTVSLPHPNFKAVVGIEVMATKAPEISGSQGNVWAKAGEGQLESNPKDSQSLDVKDQAKSLLKTREEKLEPASKDSQLPDSRRKSRTFGPALAPSSPVLSQRPKSVVVEEDEFVDAVQRTNNVDLGEANRAYGYA